MTATLTAPPVRTDGIAPAPSLLEGRRMHHLRTRCTDDHRAIYRAGFCVTTDWQPHDVHWDRRDKSYIVPLDAWGADKTRHIMTTEVRVPIRCNFNAGSAAVRSGR